MSTRQLIQFVLLLVAVGAWISYAEHPSARNLKRAIADTLPLA
jgi:hypothetical protein